MNHPITIYVFNLYNNINISGSLILNYRLLDKIRDLFLIKNKKLNSFIKYENR